MSRLLLPLHLGRILLLTALVAAPATAEEAVQRLTLEAATAQALAGNPGFRTAQQAVEVARAGLQGAGLLTNPELGLIGDVVDREATLRQVLPLGGALTLQRELAQLELERAELERDQLRAVLRADVERAYGRLAVAQAQAEVAKEAAALGATFRDVARTRFSAGDVAQLEVLQAETTANRAASELTRAATQVEIERSRLAGLVGLPSAGKLAVGDPVGTTAWPLDAGLLSARARATSPRVRLAGLAVKHAERGVALAEARRLPDVAVVGGLRQNVNDAPGPLLRLGLDVGLPIWNQQRGAIAAAHAELERARFGLEAAQREVAAEATSATLVAMQARGQLDFARTTREPQARKLYDLARRAYQQGAANILTVLEAQRDWQSARGDTLEAAGRYRDALADLDRVLGDPVPAPLERTNPR